jgi:hypothetical protein
MALGLLAGTAQAQVVFAPPVDTVTRSAKPGEAPPPATIDQILWILGEWRGAGINDAPATES